jgi:beta-lactamase class D
MRFLLFTLAVLLSTWVMAADDTLARLFAEPGLDGTMVIASVHGGQTWVHHDARAVQRFSPASTFKVFNTLMALEAKVIGGKDSVFKWDGTHYDFPDWNHDQTLETAFKVSCVWCYQDLARRVGAETYRQVLRRANYGVLPDAFDVSTFWLDGSLQVSAVEQVAFLKQVARRELPFSARTYAILNAIMLAEQTDTYRLYAKTGWAARMSPPIGWYIGYVETADDTWIFATNLTLRSEADLPWRQKLTRAALQAKGIIH